MIKSTTYLELNKFYHNTNVDLKNYPKLIRFYCEGVGIIESIINVPENLEELNCSHNIISCLDQLNYGLVKLICSYNKITKLNNLPNTLEYIDCSHNNIVYLDMISEGLKYLNCSYCKLIKLEDLPESLEILICNHNNIVSIDSLPKSLTQLDCNNNQIWGLTSLPAKLFKLNCAHNQIKTFVNLDGLNELEYVVLSHNKISGIGLDLSKCTSLKILNCSYNNIHHLPKLSNNLEELYINNNPLNLINELPENLEIIGIDAHLISDNINLKNDLIILS